MAKKLLIFFLLLLSIKIQAQKLILSDLNINNKTSFTFNINAHAIYLPKDPTQKFFVAAGEESAGNSFALAVNFPLSLNAQFTFIPLAPEKVTLNNNPDSVNPLHGAAIDHMVMLGTRPLIVKKESSAAVYAVDETIGYNPETKTTIINVFESNKIADAIGLESPKILAVTTESPELLEAPVNLYVNKKAFIAVANQNGEFDGNGSGVALVSLNAFSAKVKDEAGREIDKNFLEFINFDARTGELGNNAMPLSKNSKEIKIGSQVSSIANIIDMHFDQVLNRFYLALQVKSGPSSTDGAKAIVVGGLAGNQIIFQSIAPDSAFFSGSNFSGSKIVGTTGANTEVKIHKIRSMFTRTYLNYLIVVGGTGQNTKKTVYALPLVNFIASGWHASLAKITANPFNVYTADSPNSFLTRGIIEPAQKPEDLYSEDSVQAKVGADIELPGDITDIHVINDAVFVSVQNNNNNINNNNINQQSGIFYSQAIFDHLGKIKGWTPWQRAALEAKDISRFKLNPITGDFLYIPVINNTANNVFATQWSKGESEFEKSIIREFDPKLGGVQGLIEFAYTTNGLSQTIGNRLSLLVLTGSNKIGLIQSGQDNNNKIFVPALTDLNKVFSSNNGSLNGLVEPVSAIFVSGGDLGPKNNINSAAIVTDNSSNSGWLVVGGSNGLAILTRPNGAGFNLATGLERNFIGLTQDMFFKKLGDYRSIKKLTAIENRLYILTDNKLDRIDLDLDSIANNNLRTTTLAYTFQDKFQQIGIFSDVIISEPLALLATSNGLFRSGNNISVAVAQDPRFVNWTLVPLPEVAGTLSGQGSITRLFAISPTFHETDVAKNGNIYALNAYSGYNQAQVYRLSINLENNTVTDNSVLLFQDLFIKDNLSFFVTLEEYRNYISTDGAIIATSRSAFSGMSPNLFLLPYRLKSSQRFGARNAILLDLGINNNFRSIGRLIKSSGAGAWVVNGDFGLRLNQ